LQKSPKKNDSAPKTSNKVMKQNESRVRNPQTKGMMNLLEKFIHQRPITETDTGLAVCMCQPLQQPGEFATSLRRRNYVEIDCTFCLSEPIVGARTISPCTLPTKFQRRNLKQIRRLASTTKQNNKFFLRIEARIQLSKNTLGIALLFLYRVLSWLLVFFRLIFLYFKCVRY